ncbi:cation:proton antiporter [bacterium 1XD42-1]|nr:cation:proton antiporter [bacterium 1XD42-8]RKJ62835.1 cation:proton antiporter [bacterium 1XD42-1]
MVLKTLSENEVFITFIALALLLAGAYICGKLMETIRAPKVVGEIVGGMLFGGTFLYHFFPSLMESIFQSYPEEGKVLNLFYQLGLIFLMFSSGFNTCIDIDKRNLKIIGCVFTGATILPMAGAVPFAKFFQKYFIGESSSYISFLLVFIIGVAITSIPVISKIFFDMGIMNTAFTNTVLTVSTFQDLCLWILLNIATRMATSGEIDLLDMLLVIIFTLGMFLAAKLVSDHLRSGYRRTIKATDFYTISFIALLLISAILYHFGINIMYSAFLTGYIIKAVSQNDEDAKSRMEAVANFSFSLFIPIYFALVGIQLNLIHNFSLGRFALFFIIAFGLEAVGTIIMLLFTDLKKQVILNFAVTMNARGGPGIVLATVAYSYEIISIEFFTVLILTTMLSSLIAGYWLRYQQKKDESIFMELRTIK